MAQQDGYAGVARPEDDGSDVNSQTLVIRQLMSELHTGTVVKVIAVRPGTGGMGRVDVQPTINQIDGQGAATEHGTIYDVPYFRLQGGANAIKMDPAVNDIGWAAFASRDATNVKATGGVANPSSKRRHSMSDGFYFGGFLNGEPTQFIDFTGGGIKIVSTTKIEMNAPEITFTSPTVTHNGVNIGRTHVHTRVQPGSGVSGEPRT